MPLPAWRATPVAVAAVLFSLAGSPADPFANRSVCHPWHSCPTDTASYICGDLGHCSGCADNQYSQAGQPKRASAENLGTPELQQAGPAPAAEDPPAVLVQRLAALATARAASLATLPVAVIVETGLRLPDGLDRLAATVAQQQARVLILDPLIRVHRADENSAAETAAILDGVPLARATDCAVLLVHHTRKAPRSEVRLWSPYGLW